MEQFPAYASGKRQNYNFCKMKTVPFNFAILQSKNCYNQKNYVFLEVLINELKINEIIILILKYITHKNANKDYNIHKSNLFYVKGLRPVRDMLRNKPFL